MKTRTEVLAIPEQRSAPYWMLGIAAFLIWTLQAAMVAAQSMPGSFADLVDEFSPAVVNITTSTTVAGPTGGGPIVPEGSPLEDFFRDFQDRRRGDGAPRSSSALGSGFVISEDGFIVTNNHVIADADEIEVEFIDGTRLPAELIGRDERTDLAVLKVEADTPLHFVSFGDSDAMRVGDWVLAMGNPLGQGFSVSAGIVSARNRELSGIYDDYIQTDAAINKGNSGGPLFNMQGEVIGVNTAILSPSGGSIGIGFSQASKVVERVVDQLREFGETRRGWLGVRIQDVDADIIASIEGFDEVRGALVTDVPDGPAKEGGVMQNDLIISFNGQDVDDTRGLVNQVGNTSVGETVRVIVIRDGRSETLMVTLGQRELEEAKAFPDPEPGDAPGNDQTGDFLGVTLGVLNPEVRQELDLDDNARGLVVIRVASGSQAAEKGLIAGDLVTEAGQKPVDTIADFSAAIEEAKEAGRKSLLLLVRRGGDPRFVALTLDE